MRLIRFRHFIFLFLLILVFPAGNTGKAQSPVRFDHLGRSDGLSQSSVNCILRDHEGYLWFGTQDGLNMYDGKKFRIFQNQPGDTTSLANNYIVSICEDEKGYIWVGTMTGGLNRFDKKTKQFRVFLHSDNLNSISENTVWTVLSDNKGTIWAGTSKGLNCFEKATGHFSAYFHDPNDAESLFADMVMSLYIDQQNKIWIGTAEGLCMFDPAKRKFKSFINPAEKDMPGVNIIWSVTGTSDGKIITGTNNGVFLLNPDNGLFLRLLGSPGQPPLVSWSVCCRNDGIIWAGTADGLFQVFSANNTSRIYRHDPSDQQSISDNNIWCIVPDPAGFLWVGTKNGVSKSRLSAARFSLINDDSTQAISLSSPKVMAILKDRSGYLWIGTDGGGLNCISPGMRSIKVYNSKNSELRNDAVWALTEDPKGDIWIGNYQGGLHVFRKSTGLIKALPIGSDNPSALCNNRVLALLAGEDGLIWIGTRGGGLVKYNPVTGLFKNYQNSPGDSSSISGNTVLSLTFDHQKRLWTGIYEGGLNMLKPGTDKFISFRKKPGDNTCLSDNNVWALLCDKKGRLWLGTQGGLNYSSDPGEKMTFGYFGTQHGMISNTVFGVAQDKDGNIWTSSFNGLSMLDAEVFGSDPKNELIKNDFPGFRPLFRMFDTDHGLQGPEFNQGAYHSGSDGTVYFGGVNGLNYFTADDIKESSFMPSIVITDLRIFNKEVNISPASKKMQLDRVKITHNGNNYSLPSAVSYISELVLTYRESALSFDFASLDFNNPTRNQYAYKLSGFDRDWNYVRTQNIATYTNLKPGEYTLMIRGSNSDGIWNPKVTMMKISIVPPFWRTGWFYLLLMILLMVVVWNIITDQKRKAMKEKELMELQLKTIKSQIDPHFAFNALNTVASFIYAGEPDVTYDYFTRFAFMIRNILNDNEKISRSLHEEIEFVKNYLELQKIRFKDKFVYTVSVDHTIPSETHVPKMIIQSYAENAIKHGLMHRPKDGLLKINVEKNGTCIRISVEDNGVGREKAAVLTTNSTGRGFRIMNQIIGLYKKLYHTDISQTIEDLYDTDGLPSGTKVILNICAKENSDKRYHFPRIKHKPS